MKTIKAFALASVIAIIAISSCQKDLKTDLSAKQTDPAITTAGKPAPPAVCNSNAYVITLVSHTLVAGNWEWIWSVQNPNPGNGTNGTSQDMSHWGMQFGACLDWSDVKAASYSANGNDWTSFTPSYQVDPSQGCVITPVLKYAFGTSGTAKSYYKLVLGRNYTVDNATFGYYKSGARMPCCTFTFNGVGCPQTEEGCSFSQGLYFGSPAAWPSATVTVAGFSYTETEGRDIWNVSNAGGMKDSKKAFLQVAAIKLSAGTISPSSTVWADVAICETWLATLGKLSPANLPTGNSAVGEAAGRIGQWIEAHHCIAN